MTTAAETFRKIDDFAGRARRAITIQQDVRIAYANLLAIQGKVQHGLRDAMADQAKLKALDGLLAAMETFTDEVEALHRTLGPHRCTVASCPNIDAARAAIAKAKEQTAPDARAQATPRA